MSGGTDLTSSLAPAAVTSAPCGKSTLAQWMEKPFGERFVLRLDGRQGDSLSDTRMFDGQTISVPVATFKQSK